MAFWQRMFSMLPGERGNERDPLAPRWWGQPGMMSAAGVPVTPEMVEQLDIVQACMENIAVISTLPAMVYRRLGGERAAPEFDDGEGDADSDDKVPVPDHPVLKLLRDAPNDRQTSQEFFDELCRHLAFHRNSYAQIVPGAGGAAIGSLELIHPLRVQSVERKNGRIWYTFRNDSGTGTFTLRDDEIWHIRKAPLTRDGLRGRPVYETSKELFGKLMATEDFGAKFFRNGTNGGVVSMPGFFKDKEEQQAFLDAWREGGSGFNRHRDRILQRGATYTPDATSNDKAQFLETLKQYELKAARVWNMPPHRVGILDRATFSNIEQQSVEFVIYTLAPFICGIEQSAGRTLFLGEDDLFLEINVAGLLRGDIKTRYEAYAMARQWGWFSVNDILRLENRRSIGAQGDIYLEPQNMKPAGTETPASPAPAPAPANNPAPKE